MIAPTDKERLKYTYHLHVYAKEKVAMPVRLAILLDDYQVSLK